MGDHPRDAPALGARNTEVQTLRRLLGRRSARSETGRYVIEGPRLVLEALDAGVVLDTVYIPTGARSDDVDALVARATDAGTRLRALAPGVLEKVASTQAPQPALATALLRSASLHAALDASAPVDPFVFVLCDIADPGNAGTLLRIAEGAGATAVVVTGPAAVDVHNPKVVRAAAGSLFRMPIAIVDDSAPALDEMARRGLRRLATVVDGGLAYDDVDLVGPVALVLGSEAHGLAPEVIERLDERIRIPMLGNVESLNVAVAGAVIAFEIARRRRAVLGG